MQHKFLTDEIQSRNHLVDFIKGIAIVFVILANTSFIKLTNRHYITAYWLLMALPILMICSGFTWSQSYLKKRNFKLGDGFGLLYLLKKIVRVLLPWIFTFLVIEVTIMVWTHELDFDIWFNLFGVYTNGSYFVFILFQMIIFMPLIFVLIKQYGWKALMGCFVLTALFECLRWGIFLPEITYRYLMIRYLPFLAVGSFIATTQKQKFSFRNWKIDIVLAVTFIIGAIYLYIVFYSGYICQFFFPIAWKESTFLAALYISPIMFIILKKCRLSNPWWGFVGRRNYSIYMILIIYVKFVSSHMIIKNNDRLEAFVDFLIVFNGGMWVAWYLFEYLTSYKLMNLIQRKLDKKYKKTR